MTQELTTRTDMALTQAGQAANRAAARHTFDDYRQRKAANTLRRQDTDLVLFAEFLFRVEGGNIADDLTETQKAEVKRRGAALSCDPGAWSVVTWGLVKTFVHWQLDRGYSIGSINVRLSTVKTYAKLARLAGALDTEAAALIASVKGYDHKESKRVDETREVTRNGAKKAEPVSISRQQADLLKGDQPLTPQGRRDTVLLCLLLNHGLRVGEIAALTVANFDLQAGTMTFYRQKVDKVQTHKLTEDTWQALEAYFGAGDVLIMGPLLRGSNKSGRLTGAGMNVRNITARVKVLGGRVGLVGLSAHDCRHYWATQAARSGTSLDRLQEAGGWSSLAMPLQYIEAASIANEGVRLE